VYASIAFSIVAMDIDRKEGAIKGILQEHRIKASDSG
jgi:hypothetical protein